MNSFNLHPCPTTTAISTVRDISVFSTLTHIDYTLKLHFLDIIKSPFIYTVIFALDCNYSNYMTKLTRKIMSVSAPKLSSPEARSWPQSCKTLNYETRPLVGSGLSFPVSPHSIILIFHGIYKNWFFDPVPLSRVNPIFSKKTKIK